VEDVKLSVKDKDKVSFYGRLGGMTPTPKELYEKLEEFATYTDTLEEIHENREQIEVSKYYERLPKPSLIALEEFLADNIHYYYAKETDSDNSEERL